MKNKKIHDFDSFNLNESKDKSPLKDPKKKFTVSKPKVMTRQEIFEKIIEISESMFEDEEFDTKQLAIVLQDDRLCQKFLDQYTEKMTDFYEEQDLFDGITDTESDILGDFLDSNKALEKCIKDLDED